MIDKNLENELFDINNDEPKVKKKKSSVLNKKVVKEDVVEKIDDEQITDEMIEQVKTEIETEAKEVLPKKQRKPRKSVVRRAKGKEVKINIDESNGIFRLDLLSNKFKVILESDEYHVYPDKSNSFIIANKPCLHIEAKTFYLNIQKKGTTYSIATNQDIDLDEKIKISNLNKEHNTIQFDITNLTTITSARDKIKLEKNEDDREIVSNNVLLISEEDGKVYLPYTAEEIKEEAANNVGISIEEIIEKKFVCPIGNYKHAMKARFREAYNLMRHKERRSKKDAIFLGLELMFEFNLHPAVIAACKDLQQLDIYLDCLDDNELEKFSCFKIIYKAMPTVVKKNKTEII